MSKFAISRRHALLLGASSASLGLALPDILFAQNPGVVKIYVGFSPGGTSDSLARMTAQALSSAGTNVVVENRPGASGQLAPDAVKKAPPDGNSLLIAPASTLSLTPQLNKKVALVDPIKDLAPVACVCDHSFAVAVSASTPIKTFAELVQFLKANPNAATCGEPGGPGTTPNVLARILEREIGVPLTLVSYKGVPPTVVDLIGGQLTMVLSPYPTMTELHRGGKIRILAITNRTRISSLPDIPTFTELGIPAMEKTEWYGLFTSSGSSAQTIKKWQDQLLRALTKPEFTETAKRLDVELRPLGSDELGKMLQNDIAHSAELIKELHLTIES